MVFTSSTTVVKSKMEAAESLDNILSMLESDVYKGLIYFNFIR